MNIPDKVIDAYFETAEVLNISAFGNGHIHQTYKIETSEKDFILQKINTSVFPQPEILISNHLILQQHYKSSDNQQLVIPEIIKTKTGRYYYYEKDSGFWRLTNFIGNSYSIEKAETPSQAYEAGKAYGWFIKSLEKVDVNRFEESIKEFHSLTLRLNQFEEALVNNIANRKESIYSEIDFFLKRKQELLTLEKEITTGNIPIRIVHNDTKINNVLFQNEMAIAVIDLDTVGQGCIFYDYGDALRTIANSSIEDEENLQKVKLQWDNFANFTKAFLQQTAYLLTEGEKKLLHLAPQLMTYIIGIRFLTDYLNGDSYFKIKKPGHNLIRARVQIKLMESMEMMAAKMKSFIQENI